MEVTVVRSARRRKTVELKPTANGVVISIPAHSTKAEEERYVQQLLSRYNKRQHSDGIDLTVRAKQLAKRFKLPVPREIRWVENQNSRWGSCTPSTGTIRISNTVSKFPTWVLDYVITHELAHLLVLDHNAEFWALVNRYDKSERARGFLIAKSLDGTNNENEDADLEDEEPFLDLRDDPTELFDQQQLL